MEKRSFLLKSTTTIAALSIFASPAFADMDMTNSSTNATTTAMSGQQWNVVVGGGSSDASLQAMSFFPNVITIDAGDTVNFEDTGNSPHTVTFAGSDGKMPNPMIPGWDQPAGGTTFDGSALTSSGMLMPGKTYSLTFPKPGIYPYQCVMHPGMQGVVIVQPANTAYPFTQSQYDAMATQQSKEDLTVAQNALDSFHIKGKPGANGTTVWQAQADIPEQSTYSLNLTSQSKSDVAGSVTLSMTKPGTWAMELKVNGLTPGQTYTPTLSLGKSNSGVSVAGSLLNSFTAGEDGSADVTGTVNALSIPQGIWFVDVNDANGTSVASGVVDYPSYTDERFLPDPITIHKGDTVVWTQWGPNEAHTISFLPKGWNDIPDESMMPKPAGGSVYPGTGFFNSGFLFPGQSYKLTFDTVGNYQYRCLLHDMMGMVGKVNVLPNYGVIVSVDGKDLDTNLVPFLKDDHTMVPLRTTLETMGAQVSWNKDTQTVTATKGTTTLMLKIGSTIATVNGQSVNMDVASQLVNDSTFVPARLISTAFGYNVSWDPNTQSVSYTIK